MDRVLFILRNATTGMQIRDALRKAGIPSKLVRVPREWTDGSCTQAVEIQSRLLDSAESVLRRAGISGYRLMNGYNHNEGGYQR